MTNPTPGSRTTVPRTSTVHASRSRASHVTASQGLDVLRTDDGEVPVIEGGDLWHVEAFGDGDHGRVRRPEG